MSYKRGINYKSLIIGIDLLQQINYINRYIDRLQTDGYNRYCKKST